jgi:hypothetical protein
MSENEGRETQKFSNKMVCINRMEKLTRESVQCGDFLQLILARWWHHEADTCNNERYFINFNMIKEHLK